MSNLIETQNRKESELNMNNLKQNSQNLLTQNLNLITSQGKLYKVVCFVKQIMYPKQNCHTELDMKRSLRNQK